MTTDRAHKDQSRFRVGFVPGVTPDRWARVWAERMPRTPLELGVVEVDEQTAVLYDGRAHMCFVRLPLDPPDQHERLHVIPLYDEVPVVVVPKGHFVEAADEVSLADLVDEHVLEAPPLTVKEAVETVAAGTGVIVLPMSVARLHNRRDVAHRPVLDAPRSTVGLAWRRDLEDERAEVFVGVVRGRTANSSRGRTQRPSSGTDAPRGTRDRRGSRRRGPDRRGRRGRP